jgi:predicted amidophosphoribosyltransferase
MKGMPLPVKIRFTKKCQRCMRSFPHLARACPHCRDITDGAELEAFIQCYQQELAESRGLGNIFLFLAALLLLALLVLSVT